MRFLIRAYDRCMGWTHPLQSLFLVLIRLILGIAIDIHGVDRLKNIQGAIEYFTTLGIPQPQNVAWAVGLIEAICGLLLVLATFIPSCRLSSLHHFNRRLLLCPLCRRL